MVFKTLFAHLCFNSLNGADTSFGRAREEVEKENHQNLTPKIMNKSNPVRPGEFDPYVYVCACFPYSMKQRGGAQRGGGGQ